MLKEQHVPLGLMAPRQGGVDLCLRTAKELEEHGLHHAEFKVAEMWLHDYGWDKAVPFPVLNAPTPSVLAATATWARRLARAVNPSAALGRQVTAQVTAATVSLVAFGTNVAGGVRKALDAVASVEPAPESECRPAVGGVPLGEAVARGAGREWVTAARLSLDAWQQDAAEALQELGAVQAVQEGA